MIRLAVRVQREHAERVLAELLELAPAGVEEIDAGEFVEYAVYGAPGELPTLPKLKAACKTALVGVATSELPDGWEQRWKRFHRPAFITPPMASARRSAIPALCVRPPWEAPQQGGQGSVEQIVIDPGQAFGTGAHATTRQCLQLLLALSAEIFSRDALIDVGTGSGVLAIAAARLGYDPVIALDNEQASVQSARDNAAANRVALDVRRLDLRDDAAIAQLCPLLANGAVIAANLLAPLLVELAQRLPVAPAQLIAGGLLGGQVQATCAAFAKHLGLRERERSESDGWAAVWLSGT